MAWHFIVPFRRRLDPETEEQRFTLHEATMNDAAIGRMVGRDRTTIRGWRITRGLRPNAPAGRPAAPGEIDLFLALYNLGLNDPEIGRRIGRPRFTIFAWRRRKGLPPHKRESSCTVYLRTARSLDTAIFEGGGTLHEYIQDDSWSSWLEEMGATVW